MYKKVLAAGLAGCLAAAALTGCAAKVSAETVAATVNDTDISLGLVSFMLRYSQSQMQYYYGSYLGDSYWTSYGESTRTSVLEELETMVLLEQHMDDYGVSIDEFTEDIAEAAASFVADNDADTLAAMYVNEEIVERAMTLYTVEQSMYYAIIADVDTEVSDEEAAQKTVKYCFFSTAGTETDDDGNTIELTDEEKEAVKEQAEQVRQAVADGQDFDEALAEVDENKSATSASYGDDNGTISDTLREAAEALTEDGQVTDELVETDNGYYVLQMVSTFDEEATDDYKQDIIDERESDLYNEVTDGYKEDAAITTKDNVLKALDFTDTWTLYQETETESAAAETENGTEETAAESESAAETESESASKAESETESESASEAESEMESESASETETESESETK